LRARVKTFIFPVMYRWMQAQTLSLLATLLLAGLLLRP
jgi:hypothetical protein